MEPALGSLPDLVVGVALLILAASLTAMLSTRLRKLPFTIALVLAGMLLSELAQQVSILRLLTNFRLTPELVLFVFLPTLIFDSAYRLDARQLQSNLTAVLTLAVPGLLLSTAIIGAIVYALTGFELLVSLLLGAILSATDPVAVIALFKQLGVPERLTVLVEGESLFNDATALVMATLILGILVSGDFSGVTVLLGIGEFFWVFFGGIVVGWLLAIVIAEVLGTIDANPAVEISLTTVLAYLSFLIAEHGLQVSGIMAVVVAALTLAGHGRSKITPSTVAYLEDFWGYVAWLANAVIFLLVGMQVDRVALWQSIDLIALVFLAMLVSRAVVVFGLVPQLGRLRDSQPVSRAYQLVMFWGGLRGAIALAIVLSLPDFAQRDTLIAVVTGAVLFTLLIQGFSIEALVQKLGLDTPAFADLLARREGALHAKEVSLASLDRLEQGGFFSTRVAGRLRAESEQRIAELRREIARLTNNMSADEGRRILSMRTLAHEKSLFEELFRHGLVEEWAYRKLADNVEQQLDEVKHFNRLPGAPCSISPVDALWRRIFRLTAGLPGLDRLIERHQRRAMMRDYQVSWARYRAANSVLRDLDEIAVENGVSGQVIEAVRQAYLALLHTTQSELQAVGQQYPDFVEASQEKLAHRLLLISEQKAVDRSARLGVLSRGVVEAISEDNQRELRALRRKDLSAFLKSAAEQPAAAARRDDRDQP